jgi:hypothetical protein
MQTGVTIYKGMNIMAAPPKMKAPLWLAAAILACCFFQSCTPARSDYETCLQTAEHWLDRDDSSESELRSAMLTWDDFQRLTAQCRSDEDRRERVKGIILTAKGRLFTRGLPGAPD